MPSLRSASLLVSVPCPLSLVRHRRRTDIQEIDDDLRILHEHHEAQLLSLWQQHETRVQVLLKRRLRAIDAIQMHCNTEHLPDELLLEIFRYLVGPQFPRPWANRQIKVLNTLLLVCRRWAAICRDDQSLWRCIRIFITEVEPESNAALIVVQSPSALWEDERRRGDRSGFLSPPRSWAHAGACNARLAFGATPHRCTSLRPLAFRRYCCFFPAILPKKHMPRLRLLSLAVLDASATSQPTWQMFHAARLQHVEVEDVCSVAAFVQSIPWANLLSLELVGAASQLSPPALLHILAQTPWLVVCYAVLRQSIDTNREVLPDTLTLYPDKAVTMGYLRELVLEIIPLYGLAMPELWFTSGMFDPSTVDALRRLKTRSGQLPEEICMTAVPPGEWADLVDEFAVAFPGVAFGLSCSVLASDELRIALERCYQRFREGLNPGLDDNGRQLHVVTGEGYDYDWDYEAYSDHSDYEQCLT
ncbi:hypothetical protein C8R45DRAFT_936938 [Mycena sanguinolenta]|nr:hypothetical protein C8R45DRAFT_936938 [Mycena sanguinolenta]